ncbi:MAG TPA: DoxX family protein [Bacteroidales bacterium]|nr:DoxX family protein [Bacteroidales bacterium]
MNLKYILMHLSRLITGVVFVFSGFVKGVDPLGTAFKLQDYFNAYGTLWASDYALALSILLCTVEFIIGAALILSLHIRITSWLLLFMMSFFTLLTFYDALYAPVTDCGCFGDAIKLTNWQTFYKNLVLMIPTLMVFINRSRFRPMVMPLVQNILLVLIMAAFVGMSVWQYENEPFIDFRPWKVGNRVLPDPEAEMRVFVKYQNKETGEIREYLSPNFPWNDPEWMAAWEFLDQRTEFDSDHIIHGLMAEDESGNDFTQFLLGGDAMFVIVSWDAAKAPERGWNKASALIEMLTEANRHVALLTASLPEDMEALRKRYVLDAETFYADGTTLKTMIRSNPGLVLFHKGFVAGKWHFNNFPGPAELEEILHKLEHTQTQTR